jgi:hypothetical protein
MRRFVSNRQAGIGRNLDRSANPVDRRSMDRFSVPQMASIKQVELPYQPRVNVLK